MMNFNYPRKLYIKTYGCQMNVYDTDKIKNNLRKHGFINTDQSNEADMIILNTCHIREKAAEKIYSELGKIALYKEYRKEQGLDLITVVAGCVAQAEGEEIFKRSSVVDIIVGPQSYQTLPDLITQVVEKGGKKINLNFDTIDKFDSLKEESIEQGVSSFLTIQEGCDKFCKFCCVPYTRGAEYSRPAHEIYREAMNMVSSGALEITLLGQNVSAYKTTGPDKKEMELGGLIELISNIPNLKRIRYTTSHPNDMQENLIRAHASVPKLMPFLHLPVQSGSDNILKMMNRKHTAKQYLELIDAFRKARPNMAFSSDFIVGYPGETDQDFRDTLKLVQEVQYSQCYSFKYSPRAGTPAAAITDQVPEEVKTARITELQELLNKQQANFNKEFEGKIVEVLLDREGKHYNQLLGKSEFMQSVHVNNASGLKNKIVKVRVKRALERSLEGELIEESKSVA